ncbi:hypothetical protein JB92DRAFT_2992556, partial [Gautieria morchelliformis]
LEQEHAQNSPITKKQSSAYRRISSGACMSIKCFTTAVAACRHVAKMSPGSTPQRFHATSKRQWTKTDTAHTRWTPYAAPTRTAASCHRHFVSPQSQHPAPHVLAIKHKCETEQKRATETAHHEEAVGRIPQDPQGRMHVDQMIHDRHRGLQTLARRAGQPLSAHTQGQKIK